MTEAFEIGISLALADGVSEGIAKAQRDADAVARSVAAGALSVQRLQAAGVAALTVMRSAREAANHATPAAPGRAEAGATRAAAEVGGDAGAVTAAAPPVMNLTPVVAAPAKSVAPAALQLAWEQAPDAQGASGRGGDEIARAPDRIELVQSLRLDAQAAPVRGQSAAPGVERSEQVGEDRVGARQVGEAPGTSVLAQFAAPAVAAGAGAVAPLAVAGRGSARPAGLRLDWYGERGPNAGSAVSREVASSDGGGGPIAVPSAPVLATVPAAPVAPVAADVLQPRLAAPDRSAPGGVAAPEGAEAAGGQGGGPAGPMQGDVFLDGALVGRWMSRQLSREAGRASAGPTGFDSRRNALLPGPTVGG
jgi:hypothetical protein